MNNVDARCLAQQHRQAANDRLIDGMRALAAAEDQQRWRASALGSNLEKCLAYWHARNFPMAKILCRLLEMDCRARYKMRDHSISESWNNVWLERQGRNVFHDRRQHRRTRRVSADADHHVGRKLVEHSACVPNGARQNECSLQPRHQADVL